MNDMTVTEPGTAIALPAPTALEALLKDEKASADYLSRIIAAGDAEFASLNAATAKGRAAHIALATKASKTRAEVTRQSKALTERQRAEIASVNAGRKIFEDGLAEARDRWRQPVTDWEVAEEARVEKHKAALAKFNLDWVDAGTSSDDVRRCLSAIEATTTGDEWDEFQPVAEARKATAVAHYRIMLAAAEKSEADAAELTKLRADAEERARRDAKEAAAKVEADRIATERAEKERLAAAKVEADRIAAEKAEAARIEAEKAEADRREQHERDKAEAAEAARVEAQRQAERDRVAAEGRHKREMAESKAREEAAAQRERDRLNDERKAAAAAQAKREKDQAHRARARSEISDAVATMFDSDIATMVGDRVAAALMDGKLPHTVVML